MKVSILIQDAYKIGQILAESGETATSTQLNRGLTFLNTVIKKINITGTEISIFDKYQTTLNVSQNSLPLTDFVDVLKVQYFISSLWMDMTLYKLDQFLEISRITTTQSIPFAGYAKRTTTGIDLEFYFPAGHAYPIRVYGYKKISSQASLNSVIAGNDTFYEDYLLFKLAQILRQYHRYAPSEWLDSQVMDYEEKFANIKELNTDMDAGALVDGGKPMVSVQQAVFGGFEP